MVVDQSFFNLRIVLFNDWCQIAHKKTGEKDESLSFAAFIGLIGKKHLTCYLINMIPVSIEVRYT